MQETIDLSNVQAQPGILEFALWGVGGLLGIVGLICAILVIVKMFQNDQTALGIVTIVLFCLGIGQFVTLIVGWMKSSEWNMKGLMVTYTIAFFLAPVLMFGGWGVLMMKVATDPTFQQELEQLEEDLPDLIIE